MLRRRLRRVRRVRILPMESSLEKRNLAWLPSGKW